MLNPVVQDIKRLQTIATVLTKHGFSAVVRRTPLARYLSSDSETDTPFMPNSTDIRGESKDTKGETDRADDATAGNDAQTNVITEEFNGKEHKQHTLPNDDPRVIAQRFRLVLQDLGPTYVKLGQVMSTRVDLFPPEFIYELSLLRDKVLPIPFEEIKKQIEQSLQKPLTELFESFEESPIAAASIGQAHGAVTKDGKNVVVKVQRPNIENDILADIDILYILSSMLEATVQEIDIYNPRSIIQAFEKAILSELDFLSEAKNSEIFSSNFSEIEYVRTPKIYHHLSCKKVLTLERIYETSLSTIKGGTERAKEILTHILDATVKQVMYDGFFHGDPHPGNIFVDENNHLIYIDFGLVGRLTAEQQDIIVFIIISAMNRDIDGLSRVLLRMGEATGRVDLRALKNDVGRILDKYLIENLDDIDVGHFIQECTNSAQKHGIRLNANYAVLAKVAATIEGIMRQLDPQLDLMKVGKPYAQALAKDRFSPERLTRSMAKALFWVSSSAHEIPQQLEQVLLDLERGNFEVQVKNDGVNDLGNQVNTLATRLLLSVSATGLAISSAILLKDSKFTLFGIAFTDLIGISCLALATLFFLWSLGWHAFGSSQDMRVRIKPWIRLFKR